MQKEGQNVEQLLLDIKSIILKTIACAQPYLKHSYSSNRPFNEKSSKSTCFEVLGFDIIIDSDLKPYLLEVNHTPSFQTDSPLDYSVKKNLIVDVFNVLRLKTVLRNGKTNKLVWKLQKSRKDCNRQEQEMVVVKNLGHFEQIFPNQQFDLKEYNCYMEYSKHLWDTWTGNIKRNYS